MSDVVIASNQADAEAAEAVVQHHAQMSGALSAYVEGLVEAAGRRADLIAAGLARTELVDWCRRELLPHAAAEEEALYPAARSTVEGRLLVEGMLAEHGVIGALVETLERATDPIRAAVAAESLRAVFESHLAKENELVVPLLLSTPGVSVAALLGGMHELLGESTDVEGAGGCGSGHTCSCGEAEAPGHPELDARTIPHAIRHASIFGALETVRPGAGLVLVAPHDPVPLLDQIRDRWPGEFSVDYLESGPEAWRLELVRLAS
jgi:uncharacterized protein (DUF2249 family)/iron-sulfur cluster repair protein YtfE (RIC family)